MRCTCRGEASGSRESVRGVGRAASALPGSATPRTYLFRAPEKFPRPASPRSRDALPSVSGARFKRAAMKRRTGIRRASRLSESSRRSIHGRLSQPGQTSVSIRSYLATSRAAIAPDEPRTSSRCVYVHRRLFAC
ncbi:hypothetical protein EVAR_80013_1 [Eumeta japonica]|uniref:Uncharacterized protein n=1 Tax=Eumeta variegata TaxID=151549 RepID=A0A4C1WNN2_EUMVA|nr:hypothetical protein EVAR_80013_1 [Eumeta japonica]